MKLINQKKQIRRLLAVVGAFGISNTDVGQDACWLARPGRSLAQHRGLILSLLVQLKTEKNKRHSPPQKSKSSDLVSGRT